MRKIFKNIVLLSGLMALSVAGASALAIKSLNNETFVAEAAQHKEAFDPYVYTGSYYADGNISVDDTGDSLRSKLTTYINPPKVPEYSGKGTGSLAEYCQQADEDPTNKSNMIYLYTRNSLAKNPANSWNREHVWPKSLSNGNWGEGRAGADLLHLRPTYQTTNSTRSNIPFGNVTNGTERTYEGMTYAWTGGGYFMPLPSVRGDVARIIMYVWTAYYDEYASRRPQILSVFQSYDTLMQWHIEDQPDEMEGHRNDIAQGTFQKNRNPFVDHPDIAWKIFGNQCSSTMLSRAMSTYPADWNQSPVAKKIYLSANELTVNVGQVTKLLANIPATWSIKNKSNATLEVSQDKTAINITGKRIGETTITAKDENGNTATCKLTVTPGRNGETGEDDNLKWIIPLAIIVGVFIIAGVVVTIVLVSRRKKK